MAGFSEDDYGYDVYGGTRTPILTEHLLDYFPELMKRRNKDGSASVFANFINQHEIQVREMDADFDYIRRSRNVDTSAGQDLERLGSLYGELGKRRNRDNDEYRTYLKGLVQSFNARGTKPGLKFAIASAVNTDVENIVIEEDFTNNEYSIRIQDTDVGFLGSVVNEVAELADPSGVALAEAPVIELEGADIQMTASESAVISSASGLGSDAVVLDGTWTLS